MNAYVPKPFKQAVLLKAIKTVMDTDAVLTKKRTVDLSFLEEMACGDENFKKDMIEIFLEKIPEQDAELQEAFKNEDHETVKKVAHNMKSSLDIFLLEDLSNCAAILEQEASAGIFTTESIDKIEILHCGIIEVVKVLKELY